MARKKLVIEIDMTDENEGSGVRVIAAMTAMIEAVFDDDGPLNEKSGEVYTSHYEYEDENGDPVMEVKWRYA